METLRNLRMEFRRDGCRDRDCFVYVKAELPAEHPLRRGSGAGDGGIDWFLDRERLEEFARPAGRVQDGYRAVEICGDEVLCYSLQELRDMPRSVRDSSVASVPFVKLHWPAFVRKWMRRVALRVWDLPAWKGADWDRFNSWEYRPVVPIVGADRWCKLYGHGKGQVRLDWTQEVQDRVSSARQAGKMRGDDSFERSFERICNIARGTTRGHHEVATVRLSLDMGGFFWNALTPRGKSTMHGGLLYHGPHDGFGSGSAPVFAVTLEPCDGWSIHT